MMFRHRKMKFACVFIAFLVVTAFFVTQVINAHPAHAKYAATQAVSLTPSQFKGVNWADPRDNFANDPVVPVGLYKGDSYATMYAKTSVIVKGFAKNLSANTIRLPINPYSVNSSYWNSYTGVIDSATAYGFKVILSYWEGTGSQRNGFIDNMTSFWAMWKTVTTKYAKNGLVYFEPMNEPYGYSKSAWANLAAQWISNYSSTPRNRIIVSGTGWNDNVTSVCADSRLNGTYLSLHHYAFWSPNMKTYAVWAADFKSRIGSCGSRTVVDEWGTAMTWNLNYNGPITGNYSYLIAYVQADTDLMRSMHLGSVYWQAFSSNDFAGVEALHGSGTALTLTNNDASGVSRLKHSYGL